jgi:hypothetical protein
MDKRAVGIGAIGLVALAINPISRTGGGVAQARAASEQAQGAPSGTDLFIKPDTGRARSGAQLVNDYFQSEAKPRPNAIRPELDVVIAALPDPLDSHLDYEYDAELGALRRAFETSGYTIDRFWLPWPLDREKTELAARNNRIDTTAYRRTHPGVILFRSTDNTALRVLFIVGEVPTSGINRLALDRALEDRQAVLRDARVVARDSVLRIVGPMFTGGAASLAEALARYRAHGSPRSGDSIAVISGSATGVTARQFLPVGGRLSYHATVHSDAALERVERNVLCDLLQVPISQIARLRESTTQYGAESGSQSTTSDTTRLPARNNLKRCAGKFLDIPFPANISSLRSEYARASSTPPAEPGASGAPRISLNLSDPSRAMENPPVMSGLTPAVLDVMIDEIARTLVAHRIRAVGILATDTRDKIFLAEQLRMRRRDLTLFTTESNVLLLRKEVNPFLRGMLVFGTYPLQIDAQQWDTAGLGEQRLAFANDASEGIFNATRLQLSDSTWLAEYGVPGMKSAWLYCEPGYKRVRTNAADSIPPVWVLAVGRSGYFPITACPTGNWNGLMRRRPPFSPTPTAADHAQVLVYPIIAILLGCLVWLFGTTEWRQLRFITRKAPRMRRDTCMRAMDWALLILQAHVYAILRITALAALAAGVGLGVIHRLGDEVHGSRALRLVVVASIALSFTLSVARIVLAALAARAVMKHMTSEEWRSENRRGRLQRYLDPLGRLLMSLVAVAYLWISARFILEVSDLGDVSPMRQELFLHRAGELTGGYSPAMVMVLTAAMFALWCTWHIARIEMLLTSPSVFERASLSGSGGAPTWGGEYRHARWGPFMRTVRAQLVVLTPDMTAFGLFVVSLLAGVLLARAVVPSYEVLLFERYEFPLATAAGVPLRVTLFDILARFGLIASMAATIWATFRVARLWQSLERTLDEIGRTPRVTAFERLPRRIARLTRLNVIRPHAQKLVRSISMTQWSHMRHLYARMSPVAQAALTNGVHDVKLGNGSRIPSKDYLAELMSPVSPGLSTWEPDDFMSSKPPTSSRRDETVAIRFLFDLTDSAHRQEPANGDVKLVLARADKGGAVGEPRSTSGHIRRTFGTRGRLWFRSAEELIAVQAVDYIQWVLQHLRMLSIYIVASIALMTELIWSYELHPASTLWLSIILIAIAAVGTLLSIVVQMNRNEVLSRINGTAPGTVTWDTPFVMNLTLIAVVPLVTFVGAELPWLREAVFSWLNPLLRSLGAH